MLLVNDWFDVMNSYTKENFDVALKSGFGIHLKRQIEILTRMKKAMWTMRVAGLPFQNGIVQSINALFGLHQYVKEKYNIHYIMTSRLNQDGL